MREGTPALSPTGFRPGRAGGLYPLAPIPDPMAAPVEIPTWLVALLAPVAIGVGAWLRGFLGGLLRSGAHANLVKELRGEFATKAELVVMNDHLDRLGGKVDGVITAIGTANTNADGAREEVERVEQRMQFLEQQVLPRMDAMADQLRIQGEAIATNTATLKVFMEEMRRRQ
jgi:hypothetical protein